MKLQLVPYIEFTIPTSPTSKILRYYKSLGFRFIRGSVNDSGYWLATDGFLNLAFTPLIHTRFYMHLFTENLDLTLELLLDQQLAPYTTKNKPWILLRSPEGLDVVISSVSTLAIEDFIPPTPLIFGRFAEFSLPSPHLEVSIAFWKALGFSPLQYSTDSYNFCLISNGKLAMGLHENPKLKTPYFSYSSSTAYKTIQRLKAQGVSFTQELSYPNDQMAHGIFHAPGNLAFLLFQKLNSSQNG